jgi:hypothetical protein
VDAGLDQILYLDNGHKRPSYPLKGKKGEFTQKPTTVLLLFMIERAPGRVKRFIVARAARRVKRDLQRTGRRSSGATGDVEPGESLIKARAYRVQGTEKCWDNVEGAETISQVRGAMVSADKRLARPIAQRPDSACRRQNKREPRPAA